MIGKVSIQDWLSFINGSFFSGLFWLTCTLFLFSLFFLIKNKPKYNKSALFFCFICLIAFYPEPYYYYYKTGVVNIRYFYQMIPIMVAVGVPGVFIVARVLQFVLNKWHGFKKYTFNFKPVTIVLIVSVLICLGFSLSQFYEYEKNYIFEPIEIINKITETTHAKPIYIVEGGNDQDRAAFLIDAVQYKKLPTKDCNPEYILNMCKGFEFLQRNIFFYVRMPDKEFRGLSKENSSELKLVKEVIFERHGRRTIFSLYQYKSQSNSNSHRANGEKKVFLTTN